MRHEPRSSGASKECPSGPYKYMFSFFFQINTTKKLIKYK
jgi:hypothetical protein